MIPAFLKDYFNNCHSFYFEDGMIGWTEHCETIIENFDKPQLEKNNQQMNPS